MKRILFAFAVCSLMSPLAAHADIVYSANADYLAFVTAPGPAPTIATFGLGGVYSAGYGNTIGNTSAFNVFNTGVPGFSFVTTFAGNNFTGGFIRSNNVSVPAVVIGTGGPNGFSGLLPGEMLIHPGGLNQAGDGPTIENGVLRFVAPTAGDYLIEGSFRSLDSGSTLNLIALNGATIFSNTADDSTFSLFENLAAGSILDFIVNSNGDIGSDSTGFSLTITAIPEPGTWAMMGLCAAGLWTYRLRSRKAKPVHSAR